MSRPVSRDTQKRGCVRAPHLDILWLPRAAMKSVEGDPSDCVLVVGVSRPKMALGILTIMLLSLFLTFHMIYDTAINSLQSNTADHSRPPLILLSRRLYPSAARRLPQAIIIGVRKCGTRALLEMLYLHPMVQKAAGEVHFFDRDDNYNKGLEWYRMQMPHSYPGQITIEKSPSYFVTPEVPERIRAMNASVKLLLIVREPVTRAISDYAQLRANAATASPVVPPSASKSFEQLVLHPNGSINEAYRPLSISIYHHYLHRWLEVFPREQILVVNGDLLIEDPVSQIQKIESFLGLEPRIGTHNFYFNETKGFYCLRNETSDRCLKETKGRKHPRVNPRVLSKLRKYFGEHNQKFYELIGEEMGWPEE
ncbi:heparan sulfate glucosamine 3-O-sulfotransferase 1 [Coccinella septempunctata]|uniref:heparan sulfate glucosamine 3-O-sulfotransferase 1 n=1 Tax=Coccinella septempunctata TaxID=41139 RepID=UPI001D07D219|nr:heparan sulfate glucosamine 3-O-sulfotransferase 1 [Coccinella septempunctata]XP_044754474.1 heparan sulfate glucosamine 3-O-sulfotransferase 1 [Coccinella septempunctata]XP_044754475.1 heparan sulfate glucosamine 3-O-sulfotransferase 1 [Coccinella septempunctata]XP_044754476.1 heparan sulfate glucosamine 3-O-sulfotransferase 1 [Coccinella septempunctata]XP_044754477.1 heparan sulfate glucosamine 3-O-sulfotransferase 1 [Coccinella septempunctata]XP_044754478.1 heparan sulfate glucosamine 3-